MVTTIILLDVSVAFGALFGEALKPLLVGVILLRLLFPLFNLLTASWFMRQISTFKTEMSTALAIYGLFDHAKLIDFFSDKITFGIGTMFDQRI